MKNYLDCVNRDKGRFRSYLLGALRHFLTNEWHKANREKRGGKHTLIALDEMLAEDRWKQEPAHDATPEKIYDETGRKTLLERIVLRLRSEH
jgi:RNA polymerase sigma-70 factor (ECF subfamily)